MPDHFGDHEVQEFAREFRVEIGLAREAFQPMPLLKNQTPETVALDPRAEDQPPRST